MRKRALVFTYNKNLTTLTELMLKSIDFKCLNYDIYGLYIAENDSDTNIHDFKIDNLKIDTIKLKESPEKKFCKDNYDERVMQTRNPLRNKWFKMISAQAYKSRSLLYSKVVSLIDEGYNQITVTDTDWFLLDAEKLNTVLTDAPDDTITAQMITVNSSNDIIPDMLKDVDVPELETYYKIQGECVHTVTIGSNEFKTNIKDFYTSQSNIEPGDWKWDLWRMGISVFTSVNNCANVISRAEQLSFLFALISYCIENNTADYEPTEWVTSRSAKDILDAVLTAAINPESTLRKIHTNEDDYSDEQWQVLVEKIKALQNIL